MRVLIVDDHPLYREGLKALLTGLDPGVETVDSADVSEAERLVGTVPGFDLILLDMNLPGTSRLAALQRVKAAFEAACLVVVSAEEDPALITQVIDAGAAGYIPKNTDVEVTIRALQLVLAHGIYVPSHALRSMSGLCAGAAPAATASSLPEFSER
jgi:DNA-binding NarL/FixJ family response regulator